MFVPSTHSYRNTTPPCLTKITNVLMYSAAWKVHSYSDHQDIICSYWIINRFDKSCLSVSDLNHLNIIYKSILHLSTINFNMIIWLRHMYPMVFPLLLFRLKFKCNFYFPRTSRITHELFTPIFSVIQIKVLLM